MMKELNLLETLKNMAKNAIRLTINPKDGVCVGRFGGSPDVPKDFIWPTFLADTSDNKQIKSRPLSFLAQFDCALLAPMDTEHLLPERGILSFFYELDSQTWGFSPKDAGSAKVFYFPEKDALKKGDFPADLDEAYRLPPVNFFARAEIQYPDFQDIKLVFPEISNTNYWQEIRGGFDGFCDEYDTAIETLQGADNELHHQILGWPCVIQNTMPFECEMVKRGYDMGNTLKDIPKEIIDEAKENSLADWTLLFQLESEDFNGYDLCFGDCGSIYFYIRKEELKECRFDQAWLILQCY